jgi:hypothetical protein
MLAAIKIIGLLLSTMLIDDEAIVNHSKLRMREADHIQSG